MNAKTKYDIFISYRREGGFEVAKLIKECLERDGYSVSFDLDNLSTGDFRKQLMRRIDNCRDFILICDKNAFDRVKSGSSPLKEDWLVQELAEALRREKNVIPIMLEGFNEFPNVLPNEIADVKYKNGPQYNKVYFNAFYERLKHFFLEAHKEDIIAPLTPALEQSLLLEHGWHLYNMERYDEAMEYFLKAADLGSANAFNAIAIYHYEGRGHEKNLQKAAQWFRYSAEMGYASVQRNLGDCYRKGEGVPKNEEEAVRWYLRACDKENVKAQSAVAECYENGWGVPKDLDKAKEYYEKAASQGYELAKEKCRMLSIEEFCSD